MYPGDAEVTGGGRGDTGSGGVGDDVLSGSDALSGGNVSGVVLKVLGGGVEVGLVVMSGLKCCCLCEAGCV